MNTRILRMCRRTHGLTAGNGRREVPRGTKGHGLHTLRIVKGLQNQMQPVAFGCTADGRLTFTCEDVTAGDRRGLWRLPLPESKAKVKRFFAILEGK